jgi:hypothetical protein
MTALLLVDLENVQTIDLAVVPATARVLIFHGANQKKLPIALVKQAQVFGDRLQWIPISGQGANALDFHIAYYLGRELAANPKTRCVILSKDQGFDPLVRHIVDNNAACQRVATLKGIFPTAPENETAPQDPFTRTLTLLRKEKARPRFRKGLVGKVSCYFPKQSPEECEAIVERLFETKHVAESGDSKSLIYQLGAGKP